MTTTNKFWAYLDFRFDLFKDEGNANGGGGGALEDVARIVARLAGAKEFKRFRFDEAAYSGQVKERESGKVAFVNAAIPLDAPTTARRDKLVEAFGAAVLYELDAAGRRCGLAVRSSDAVRAEDVRAEDGDGTKEATA